MQGKIQQKRELEAKLLNENNDLIDLKGGRKFKEVESNNLIISLLLFHANLFLNNELPGPRFRRVMASEELTSDTT